MVLANAPNAFGGWFNVQMVQAQVPEPEAAQAQEAERAQIASRTAEVAASLATVLRELTHLTKLALALKFPPECESFLPAVASMTALQDLHLDNHSLQNPGWGALAQTCTPVSYTHLTLPTKRIV